MAVHAAQQAKAAKVAQLEVSSAQLMYERMSGKLPAEIEAEAVRAGVTAEHFSVLAMSKDL